MRNTLFISSILLFLFSCSKGDQVSYSNDLSNPEDVLDNFIKTLVYGDVKQSFYYVIGNYKEYERRSEGLGYLLEEHSKERAKFRYKELYHWNIINKISFNNDVFISIEVSVPNGGKMADKSLELMGYHFNEKGKMTKNKGLSKKEANLLVRKDKSIPPIIKEFRVKMKKNQYGWIYDISYNENTQLMNFIQQS